MPGAVSISSCKNFIKAVAFELRPFPIPTKNDLEAYAKSFCQNSKIMLIAIVDGVKVLSSALRSVNLLVYLKILAWFGSWWFFSYIEFGVIFFILSAMALMLINLGDENDRGEWSAYSVFNAGCRAMMGTLNAEQFEREIMHQDVRDPRHNYRRDNVEDEDIDGFVVIDRPNQHDGNAVRNRRGRKGRRHREVQHQPAHRNAEYEDMNEFSSDDDE